jgi:hypothetical protein
VYRRDTGAGQFKGRYRIGGEVALFDAEGGSKSPARGLRNDHRADGDGSLLCADAVCFTPSQERVSATLVPVP